MPRRSKHMKRTKLAISLDAATVDTLDRLAKEQLTSRSQLVAVAISEKAKRSNRNRLARECAKLDPQFEKALAEEGFSADVAQWPEY